MATVLRPEVSKKNKYWIDKHRHYELKHFCLQYPLWKRAYADFDISDIRISSIERSPTSNLPGDPTAVRALVRAHYLERINLVEQTAVETDQFLHNYILKGVTEGLSYTYLKTSMGMPCSKDTYYDRYRKFFWLLNRVRD